MDFSVVVVVGFPVAVVVLGFSVVVPVGFSVVVVVVVGMVVVVFSVINNNSTFHDMKCSAKGFAEQKLEAVCSSKHSSPPGQVGYCGLLVAL